MVTLRIPRHITAIDSHVHPNTAEARISDGEYVEWAKKYFKTGVPDVVSYAEMAEMYRSRKMMCVLLGKDEHTVTGLPPIPNDSIAQAMRDFPDAFIGFGAVDPHMGTAAVREVRRIAELGLRGLKFHPIQQRFFPDDRESQYTKRTSLWTCPAGRPNIFRRLSFSTPGRFSRTL